MSEAFELRDPAGAQALLESVIGELRQKGEALFRGGRVGELVTEEPGLAYSTGVAVDGAAWRVSLRYGTGEGWRGSCSCARRFKCEHVYAAVCALLAEYRTVVVRGLSASLRPAMPIAASPARLPAPEDAGPMLDRLRAALGRPVTMREMNFVQQVKAAYVRCRQRQRITHWDFGEMGLPLGPAPSPGPPLKSGRSFLRRSMSSGFTRPTPRSNAASSCPISCGR